MPVPVMPCVGQRRIVAESGLPLDGAFVQVVRGDHGVRRLHHVADRAVLAVDRVLLERRHALRIRRGSAGPRPGPAPGRRAAAFSRRRSRQRSSGELASRNRARTASANRCADAARPRTASGWRQKKRCQLIHLFGTQLRIGRHLAASVHDNRRNGRRIETAGDRQQRRSRPDACAIRSVALLAFALVDGLPGHGERRPVAPRLGPRPACSSRRSAGLFWPTTYTMPVVGSAEVVPNSAPPLLPGMCTGPLFTDRREQADVRSRRRCCSMNASRACGVMLL